MKKRMEIKLTATFVFDVTDRSPDDEGLMESLAATPLALAFAEGLQKRGFKVTDVENADRYITDLDLTIPSERRVRIRKKKAG